MEHLLNDHEDRSNQHENSHKLCDETKHPVLSSLESQWKLRQPRDQNFPIKESHCRTNTSTRRNKSKRAELPESQSGIQVEKLTI